jgi:hypothetical protein
MVSLKSGTCWVGVILLSTLPALNVRAAEALSPRAVVERFDSLMEAGGAGLQHLLYVLWSELFNKTFLENFPFCIASASGHS